MSISSSDPCLNGTSQYQIKPVADAWPWCSIHSIRLVITPAVQAVMILALLRDSQGGPEEVT